MKLAIFFFCLFLTTVYAASVISEEDEFRMEPSDSLETERILSLIPKTLEDLTKTVKNIIPL
uniref:U56-Sparatoxin-Hju1a_4 n=1 Tax=Heteropoda jugulans TaxID=1358901 RepID=A0A4Q8K896_9ARAC